MIRSTLSLAAACAAFTFSTTAHAAADYHDVAEMQAALSALDGAASGRMRVVTIGRSFNDLPIQAVHIGTLPYGDVSTRSALMIECGTHAREWASPELCLRFLEKFAEAAEITDPGRVDDVLEHTDLWVIPMVNPDGRVFDDPGGGDPTNFSQNTFFHPAHNDAPGWRDNLQPASCPPPLDGPPPIGIDLNRAYSEGWDDGIDDCRHNQYHGEYPFEAVEARVMRRFVNNHMISMAASIHANGQCLNSLNAPWPLADNARSVWDGAVTSATEELDTSNACMGNGVGQFTSWLANPSDVASQLDESSERGVQSFLFELPIQNYASSAYIETPGDGSNHFHPSSAAYVPSFEDPFADTLLYLAEQARMPWCPLDPVTLAPSPTCADDFGLTGSKIATCEGCIGALDFRDTGLGEVREVLPAGDQRVVFRVQNFDATANGDVETSVRVLSRGGMRPGWRIDLIDDRVHALAPGEAKTVSIGHTFEPGREYEVSVLLTPVTSSDVNPDNDHHVFRFETP